MDAWHAPHRPIPSHGSPTSLDRDRGRARRARAPGDAEHGDYATNVALKLAGLQQRPPREIADEIAAQAVEGGLAERAESAGPGFVNLWVSDAWLADGVGAIVEAGGGFGAGIGSGARADPGRDGVGESDRADHGRARAERRLR